MPTIIWTALLPYTGRAIRFEASDTAAALKIAEGAESAVGVGVRGTKWANALQRETLLTLLRGITTKPVPLVFVDAPILDASGKPALDENGKPKTMQVIDEEATLKAIERDEDAIAKGCPWVALGHLDMITAGNPNELMKLLPLPSEYVEAYKLVDSAGAKPRLPLAGKARMTVTG